MNKKDELVDKELAFRQKLQNLKGQPVQQVNDFQKPLVKELPVEKINTVAPQKIKSGSEFLADRIIQNANQDAKRQILGQVSDSLNYNDLRKQFMEKAKSASKVARTVGNVAGKKVLGAIPIIGGIANAMMSNDASAAVPILDEAESVGPAKGSFDDRMENGQLSPEEKQQLMLQQARIKALRGM
jgi:hypothetical protein